MVRSEGAPLNTRRLAQRGAVVFGSMFVILVLAWLLGDPLPRLRTDWTAFDNAADRLVAGEEVYRPWNAESETLPYLYPPFALWLSLPLALGGFLTSWFIAASMTAVSSAVGVALLLRSTPEHIDRRTAAVGLATCGSFFGASLLGQYSGFYVLAFGLSLLLWSRDRQALAGLALAILLMKPNIAIAVPVILVWSRSWRVLAGFAGGAVLALGASIPFGVTSWESFVANVRDMGERQLAGQLFESKFVNVAGAFQTWSGAGSQDTATITVWLVSTLVLGVVTLLAWHPSRLDGNLDRALGVLALFVIVANTRMYFYDGALAMWGLGAVWLHGERAGTPDYVRRLSLLAVPVWLFSWGNVFEVLNAFFAICAASVLVAVGLDMVGWTRAMWWSQLSRIPAELVAKTGIVLSGVVIALLAMWVLGDPGRLDADWTAFDLAADRLLAGESPYRFAPEIEPFPYLYPPFALLLALPLAAFGAIGSWAVSAVLAAGGCIAAVRLVASNSSVPIPASVQLALMLSGAGVTATLIGQYSGLLALSVAAGMALHYRGRFDLAGASLALLLIKPNVAIVVLVVAVWSRNWRLLRGFLGVGALLALATVPLGWHLWADWLANVERIAEVQADGGAPVDKMITMSGAVQALFGMDQASALVVATWLFAVGSGGLAVLRTWSGPVLREMPVVSYGALCCFMVAANPRLYFYDGTLFAVGLVGLVAIARDPRTSSPGLSIGASAVVVVGWIALWGGVVSALNVLTGPLALVSTVLFARAATTYLSREARESTEREDSAQMQRSSTEAIPAAA